MADVAQPKIRQIREVVSYGTGGAPNVQTGAGSGRHSAHFPD